MGAAEMDGRLVAVGEGADKGFVGVGFGAAEFVIDVEDGVRRVEFMEGVRRKTESAPPETATAIFLWVTAGVEKKAAMRSSTSSY